MNYTHVFIYCQNLQLYSGVLASISTQNCHHVEQFFVKLDILQPGESEEVCVHGTCNGQNLLGFASQNCVGGQRDLMRFLLPRTEVWWTRLISLSPWFVLGGPEEAVVVGIGQLHFLLRSFCDINVSQRVITGFQDLSCGLWSDLHSVREQCGQIVPKKPLQNEDVHEQDERRNEVS